MQTNEAGTALLARGDDLVRRGISINTVRTQLKSTLSKGGFARQVDLVNQLSKLLH